LLTRINARDRRQIFGERFSGDRHAIAVDHPASSKARSTAGYRRRDGGRSWHSDHPA
jgi:hypothetical protein